MTKPQTSFHVLGPLEVRIAERELVIGGAKQRAVLAVLLLRAGEVVPVGRLVDEVWGDDPPPSAAHSLESYVSRLRQLFSGHGPRLVRRGAGYVIELEDATLDARRFVELQEQASLAAAMDDHVHVVELTAAALAMWRGPALADVALASAGRAEADRLEEQRLRTYELRFDAELALDCHEQAIGELQTLVAQNPYRERFVAQLMLALYRCGRHAEALDAYEQTRRRLDDDLGLQPSTDLQQLSGQIVRQDPVLSRPAAAAARPSLSHAVGRRTRRMVELVAAGSLVAAAMAFTASGSAPRSAAAELPPGTKRVALVLPRDPTTAAADDLRIRKTAYYFRLSTGAWDHETETFVANEIDPTTPEIERITDDLEKGDFAAVLVLGDGATARSLAPLVRRHKQTRFVFIDASLSAVGLAGVRNATGIPFADHEAARLAGYLSGLVPPRDGDPQTQSDAVSIVAAPRTARTERVVQGFVRGVRQALPRVAVRVDYVADTDDKTSCELLANRQVSAGSDVVFAFGGACGSAALATARVRGVWGVRANDDGAADGPHLLATTSKWWEKAVGEALDRFELGILPRGRDLTLGLADEYAVLVETESPEVSELDWAKVVELCSSIRRHSASEAP